MARTRSSDEQHLLELVSLLPGWEEERFWNRVAKVSGCDSARLDFSTALGNAVSPGNCMSLSHLVLGIFGRPERRAELACLIPDPPVGDRGWSGAGMQKCLVTCDDGSSSGFQHAR
jgi:hypothetical protein